MYRFAQDLGQFLKVSVVYMQCDIQIVVTSSAFAAFNGFMHHVSKTKRRTIEKK